jgi:hypothetical protein
MVNGKWRALVRRKGFAHRCITGGTAGVPNTKAAVTAAARRVESAIEGGQTSALAPAGRTIGQLLRAYRELRDVARPIADTSNEHYMLRLLEAGLGHLAASAATTADLVGYCRARRADGAGPYTCNMEVSKLGTAMRYAGAAEGRAYPDLAPPRGRCSRTWS